MYIRPSLIVRRAFILLTLPSIGCSLVGCQAKIEEHRKPQSRGDQRPEGVTGYYRLDDPAKYGAKSMKDVPVGQVRYLGIENGHWLMRDMLTAFGGTWTKTPTGAKLTVVVAPSGPAKKRETLEVERTATGVTLLNPKEPGVVGSFTYIAASAPADFGYEMVRATQK